MVCFSLIYFGLDFCVIGFKFSKEFLKFFLDSFRGEGQQGSGCFGINGQFEFDKEGFPVFGRYGLKIKCLKKMLIPGSPTWNPGGPSAIQQSFFQHGLRNYVHIAL